jgi:serine O-acetyltransferase
LINEEALDYRASFFYVRKMRKEELFSQIGQFKKNINGRLPSVLSSTAFANNVTEFLFPVLSENENHASKEAEFDKLKVDFIDLLIMMGYQKPEADIVSQQFLNALPNIYENLLMDAEAIFNGDPAAHSVEEVVLSYPGFWAICIYRFAHEILNLRIPMLARIFSEYAHSKTGIDIHPGAQIGHSFCIDHGTGIVIGETAVLGNHVIIYQSVTIGALSLKNLKTNSKRHPSIKDNVTLYAGATILGGNTVVGENSIIGGNVWLIESVAPNSLVTNSHKVQVRQKNGIKNI